MSNLLFLLMRNIEYEPIELGKKKKKKERKKERKDDSFAATVEETGQRVVWSRN